MKARAVNPLVRIADDAERRWMEAGDVLRRLNRRLYAHVLAAMSTLAAAEERDAGLRKWPELMPPDLIRAVAREERRVRRALGYTKPAEVRS